MQIEKIAIRKEIMCIDTARQTIDMQQIQNRRFLYNPRTGILVLGFQYAPKSPLLSSHADELAGAGITKDFDDYVRGWVGTGRSYPKGVIHFAPSVVNGVYLCLTGLSVHWKCFRKTARWLIRSSVDSENNGNGLCQIFWHLSKKYLSGNSCRKHHMPVQQNKKTIIKKNDRRRFIYEYYHNHHGGSSLYGR